MQVRHQELLLKLLQQQAPPTPPTPGSPPPLWAGLTKQGLSMKALLEHKPPPTREPTRTQAPNHRVVSKRDPKMGGGTWGFSTGPSCSSLDQHLQHSKHPFVWGWPSMSQPDHWPLAAAGELEHRTTEPMGV